jgi:signal transduction histidine kinase
MGKSAAVNPSFSTCEFCDYIAHEIANPLNGMLISVEFIERCLQTRPNAVDEIGDLPGMLKREIERLILLLNELRSSGVLVASELQPVSLPTEIGELLALESAYYAKRGVRVNQHFPLELPRIMADRDRLRQVLLNLCKNAVEAMPNGGTLTLRTYVSEERVCLDIVDTGKGIPKGMRVFERAVTNKLHSNGLGLAIVREIVKQHEGTVSHTTRPGKGATFHLKFPIPVGQTLNRSL